MCACVVCVLQELAEDGGAGGILAQETAQTLCQRLGDVEARCHALGRMTCRMVMVMANRRKGAKSREEIRVPVMELRTTQTESR